MRLTGADATGGGVISECTDVPYFRKRLPKGRERTYAEWALTALKPEGTLLRLFF